MTYRSMLVHSCNIYKFKPVTEAGTYGAPGVTKTSYSDTPEYTDVPCLFSNQYPKNTVDYNGVNKPGVDIKIVYLINFMKDADIGLGDLVEWKGHKYRLDVPYYPQDHHAEVVATRYDEP